MYDKNDGVVHVEYGVSCLDEKTGNAWGLVRCGLFLTCDYAYENYSSFPLSSIHQIAVKGLKASFPNCGASKAI